MVRSSHNRGVAVTPLGSVTLDVSGPLDVAIEVAPATTPELPEGMAVDGLLLFSILLRSTVTPRSPAIITATADQDGDPESGERLDSMVFESAGGFLQLAVRDDEYLAAKCIIAEPVRYGQQGLSQTITSAPAGTVLYASVAWRRTSTTIVNDLSTWFAADLALPG